MYEHIEPLWQFLLETNSLWRCFYFSFLLHLIQQLSDPENLKRFFFRISGSKCLLWQFASPQEWKSFLLQSLLEVQVPSPWSHVSREHFLAQQSSSESHRPPLNVVKMVKKYSKRAWQKSPPYYNYYFHRSNFPHNHYHGYNLHLLNKKLDMKLEKELDLTGIHIYTYVIYVHNLLLYLPSPQSLFTFEEQQW